MTAVSSDRATRSLHLPFPRHDRTAFIQIDTRRCAACGECVSTCPHGVLGIVSFFNHRHVHVDYASQCKGCRKCVKSCSQGAIQPRPREVCRIQPG